MRRRKGEKVSTTESEGDTDDDEDVGGVWPGYVVDAPSNFEFPIPVEDLPNLTPYAWHRGEQEGFLERAASQGPARRAASESTWQ